MNSTQSTVMMMSAYHLSTAIQLGLQHKIFDLRHEESQINRRSNALYLACNACQEYSESLDSTAAVASPS
jgi:hypothetical protein